ncbi:MAG: hypothetical protein COA53_08620 [Rhodobacteraceae bacterium]|nr:MAG: hypothetical protein COA53_08620 [Paracoccaceae bacterium]
METGKRTLVKTIIWQIVGLITMSAVGFAITGSIISGGVLALANTGVGIITYITYERIWSRINWGRRA